MNVIRRIYRRLPEEVKPTAKTTYYSLLEFARRAAKNPRGIRTDAQHHDLFVASVFDSTSEYEEYVSEFEEAQASDIMSETKEKFGQLTGSHDMGTIGLEIGAEYYALVRKFKPSVLVETGVCNGLSTLCILLALERNEQGELYSIDYPYRADEPLEEFRAETFQDYGGAAIPSDKDPGWIVPDHLRDRWNLTVGKSQRRLPPLLNELGEIDFFVHDSEHSAPCMMFEYELAWEYLTPRGVLLSDDIQQNDMFDAFLEWRDTSLSGRITNRVGYALKPDS